MCGLVGFSSNKENTFNTAVIRTLLWYNSEARKSKHATGIFTPSMGIIKDVVEAKVFFNNDKKMSLLEEVDSTLMGHVRAATVGDAKDPNSAHPWDFGDIVMMHNGTLKNHEELANNYNIKKEDWSVDSQVLGLCLQDNFKTNNPFKVLGEYVGAAAVIVYHKKLDCLFVYRDNERTLFYGYLGKNMYISSEEDILKIVGCKDVKSFEPYKVHMIKDGKIVSKVIVKRKLPRKNNIILNILEDVSKLFSFKKYNTTKYMIDGDNYTGFSRSFAKARMLEGYRVRAVCSTSDNSSLAKITESNWYKVGTVIDENSFNVTGDDNKTANIYTSMVDVQDFIPVRGSYVIPVDKVHSTDLKIGEMYEVLHHKYGFDDIVILDHLNNTIVTCTISNLRKASNKEVLLYFSKLKEENSCEIINLTKEKAKETQIIEDAEVVEDSDDEPIDESILMLEAFMTSLILVRDEVKRIIETKSDDIKSDFNLVTNFINSCLDIESDFLLNVNENSLKNLKVNHA